MPPPRQAFFAPTAIPQSLPLEGFAVLNDTPVACQTRGPTRRETGAPISRRRQPPPTHCGAKHRNGRDLIIANASSAPDPTLAQRQRQRRKRYKRSLNRQCYPLHFMRECIPPNLHDPQRAKGPLDRRSKRLSFPHFFLRRKKCGRRRLAPAGGVPHTPAASAATNQSRPPGGFGAI